MSSEIMFWWLLQILDESACSYNIFQDISLYAQLSIFDYVCLCIILHFCDFIQKYKQ